MVSMWNVQSTLALRPLLKHVPANSGLRAICTGVIDHYHATVLPSLSSLRHQVVHGDLNLGNLLLDGSVVTGVVDFGDMSRMPLVADVAAALCSLGVAHVHQGIHELLRMARVLLVGYQSVVPLTEAELALLGDLWMVRTCCEVVLDNWRRKNAAVKRPSLRSRTWSLLQQQTTRSPPSERDKQDNPEECDEEVGQDAKMDPVEAELRLLWHLGDHARAAAFSAQICASSSI